MSHPSRSVWLPLLLCWLFAATLCAQGAWSPHFDQPGFGIAGRVFALGTFRNELIAGTYREPWRDGARLQHVARFDGVRWQPLGSGVNGAVRAAVEFQGSLYIGGEFGQAGGAPALRVARWDGAQWHPVGQGLAGTVWALCEHQGALYAAGEFVVSGSQPVRGLARWTGSQWLEVGGGVHRTLWTHAVPRALHSDGNLLYVGGELDRAGTTPVGRVAAWDGSQWHTLGGGVSGAWVDAIALHNGRLYCGGVFDQAGGVPADNLAAFDGAQWHAVGSGVQASTYVPRVSALCVWNQQLWVAGYFTAVGATPAAGVARFDGTQLHSVGGVGLAESNPPEVFAMVAWNDRLYCGGEFQIAGQIGQPVGLRAVYHLASYDGADWQPVGDGQGFGDEVHLLARYQGQVVAGGRFLLAGDRWTSTLARFDGTRWQPFGTFDGLVHDAVEHNGELWVVGEFGTVDGAHADGVARYTGTGWDTLGGTVAPNHPVYCVAVYQGAIHIGSVGAPRRWTGSGWQTFAPSINGALLAMHEYQGQLWIGGSTVGTPRLHRWNGTTAVAADPGFNGSVEALGTFGADLIVGGRFTQAGTLAARSLARWNGSTWSTLGTGTATTLPPGNVGIAAITTLGGQLVVGGSFNRGTGAPADYLMRWTGSTWVPFAPAEASGAVFALLADDARGELHVGGWITAIGGRDAGYYGLWQNVPFWTTTGQALGSPRRAPKLTGDGSLLPGSELRWRLSSALESTLCVFVTGLSRIDVPVFGGTVVPNLDVLTALPTDAIGTATLALPWIGLPPGFEVWTQVGVIDPAGPQGWTLSDTVWLRVP
ncbi:MAG: hypothetical protein JNL08_01460 [Planctomycetes bacterium]|nr:hypothetical protein [Planctomycetota bacterium]